MTFALPQLSKENLIKATIFAAAAGLALGLNLHPGPKASAAGSSRYSGTALQLAPSNSNSPSDSSAPTDNTIPGVPNQDFSSNAASTGSATTNPVRPTSNVISSGQVNTSINVSTNPGPGVGGGSVSHEFCGTINSCPPNSNPTTVGNAFGDFETFDPTPQPWCPPNPRMMIACKIPQM